MRKKSSDWILYSILAAVFVVLSAASKFYLRTSGDGEPALEILRDGVVLGRASLADTSKDMKFQGEWGFNVVSFETDGAFIRSADCRGGDCLRMSPIRRPGEAIICAPHKFVLRITRADSSRTDADAVTY
jgi:hypothetical protein